MNDRDSVRCPPWSAEAIGRRPMGLYVHIPFCLVRCGYCAFVTRAEAGPITAGHPFLTAVLAEVDTVAAAVCDRAQLATVYVGGGTPTMLEASALSGLLASVRRRLPLADDVEVTVEANPETLDARYLDALLDAGVNRLSLGLQSTEPRVLRLLDRPHAADQALAMARRAVRAGFGSVSLDVIGATPTETADEFGHTLADVVSTGVGHVSMYLLGIEPGTPLARSIATGRIPEPAEDTARARYLQADAALAAAGFAAYEISNWARSPGDQSRHNLIYWRNHDWWGVGPGAHSHLGGVRWWNTAGIDRYIAGTTVAGWETVDPEQERLESIMLGLRLNEGVGPALVSTFEVGALAALVDEGLVTHDGPSGRVRLTLAGRVVADSVIRRLAA